MKFTEISRRLDQDIADLTGRFEAQQIVDAVDDAVLAVVRAKPEAHVVKEDFTVQPGSSVQSLPPGGIAIVDCYYNYDADGNPAEIITKESRAQFDIQVTDWMRPSPLADQIQHFFVDKECLETFHIFPVPTAPITIYMGYAKAPEKTTLEQGENIENTAAVLPIGEQYRNAVLAYAKYRLYSADEADPVMAETAMKYLNEFYQSLGLNMKAEYRIVGNK